jgi:hypothetical protein
MRRRFGSLSRTPAERHLHEFVEERLVSISTLRHKQAEIENAIAQTSWGWAEK